MMKWWGWGDPSISFDISDKPNLWPFIRNTLGLTDETRAAPVSRDKIVLPVPTLQKEFTAAVRRVLAEDQVSTDDDERLLHAYGKSFPDIFRARNGIFRRLPDMIILPRSHEDVVAVIQVASAHGVAIIPFGGGTNIVGCLEVTEPKTRMVVSLDLREMNRLLSIDKVSLTATIQAGALGPKLEADLEEKGFALGHHPDSFQYSTLGGWIATRSAGMQ